MNARQFQHMLNRYCGGFRLGERVIFLDALGRGSLGTLCGLQREYRQGRRRFRLLIQRNDGQIVPRFLRQIRKLDGSHYYDGKEGAR